MTEDELRKIINEDEYLIKRKNPNDHDKRKLLGEVNHVCPLCGKNIYMSNEEKRTASSFEIAHIYPNSPSPQFYLETMGLERLGRDSEDLKNKIPLCFECHNNYDYRPTKSDYIKLLEIKKRYLENEGLRVAVDTLELEEEIRYVVEKIASDKDIEVGKLTYDPVIINKKLKKDNEALRIKIWSYVQSYYTYIRDCFKALTEFSYFNMDVVSLQIKTIFTKLNGLTSDKELIFDHIVNWLQNKTQSRSRAACEAVVSYFVQNCEVFNEITE